MTKVHTEDLFWTTDIGLATVLMLTLNMEDIDITDPKKVVFAFDSSYQLDDMVKAYWNKELQVEPQAFYSQLLMLRKRINQATDR